jgi:hypothetical protein
MVWLLPLLLAAVLPASSADPPDVKPRALWVWDTAPLLADAHAREAFLAFCDEREIGAVALQVRSVSADGRRRIEDADRWAALLADLHRRGIRAHALDGDPHYALRAGHDTVLSIVDAVVAYNDAAADRAHRFDGVHLDVEPHLLPDWSVPGRRESLLAEYLDVIERAATRARAAGLVYGVDIPFWWGKPDVTTGEAIGNTTFRGSRKPASEHVLAIADYVFIMNYRREATGQDGIIAHALDTLRAADEIGGVRVVVGVETEEVSDGVPAKATFDGMSLDEMNAELDETEDALSRFESYDGIAIHRYTTFRRIERSPER